MTPTRQHFAAWFVAGVLAATGTATAQVSTESRQQAEREAYNCAITGDCYDKPGTRAAPGIWGALAVSRETLISGGAWEYASERAARAAAAKNCNTRMNAMRDCPVVAAFANACMALATSEGDKALGMSVTSRTAKAAQADAVDRCARDGGKACKVTIAFCSPGGEARTLEQWSALAVSQTTLVSGATWEYGRREDADRDALAYCAKQGARDCRLVSSNRTGCTALATSSVPQNAYAVGGPAPSARRASDDALAQCRRAGGQNCAVALSTCPDQRTR